MCGSGLLILFLREKITIVLEVAATVVKIFPVEYHNLCSVMQMKEIRTLVSDCTVCLSRMGQVLV